MLITIVPPELEVINNSRYFADLDFREEVDAERAAERRARLFSLLRAN